MSLLLAAGSGGGSVAYSLTCAAGTYTLTGNAATLRKDSSLVCSTGSYSLTGSSTTLNKVSSLVCTAGSYTLTGTSNVLQVARTFSCAAGDYSLSGYTTTLTYSPGTGGINYTLSCNNGTYTVTGQTATLTKNFTLSCSAGNYAITGQDATLDVVTGAPTFTRNGGDDVPRVEIYEKRRTKKDTLDEDLKATIRKTLKKLAGEEEEYIAVPVPNPTEEVVSMLEAEIRDNEEAIRIIREQDEDDIEMLLLSIV